MLSSNRRSDIALGGLVVVGLLLSIAMAQWVTASHLPSSPSRTEPSRQGESKQAQTKPIATPVQGNESGSYDPGCPYPKNREDADLCEQRRMAKAAEQTLALADSQFWWNVTQAVGTMFAALAAAWAAWAANEAARQTARSVDVQIRADGPLLHVQDIVAFPDVANHLLLSIRNSGKTPAILTESSVEARIGTRTLTLTPVYDPRERRTIDRKFLGPAEIHRLLEFSVNVQPVFESNEHAVLWGYVKYEDVFGQVRKMGFGYKTMEWNDGAAIFENDAGDQSIFWQHEGGKVYNHDREVPEAE